MTEQPARQGPNENERWVHGVMREDAHREHDRNSQFRADVNEMTVRSSDNALRAALLINGGAAVSMLAFISGLVGQNRIDAAQMRDIASSLMIFAFGVAAAVAAMAFSYFTNYYTVAHTSSFEKIWQHPYLRPGPRTQRLARIRSMMHGLAIVLGLLSIVLFIGGMVDVRQSVVRSIYPSSSSPTPQVIRPAR